MIDPGFTTPTMAALFSPEARIQAMLRVEAALAVSQAKAGIIPFESADEIRLVCERVHPNPDSLLAQGWIAGTPVLPLLDYLRLNLSTDSALCVHRGATTQDIVDTATMLQLLSAATVLDEQARVCADSLRTHLATFGAVPVMARSFLQLAEPTTFNLRGANWLAPLVDAIVSMNRLSFPVQLGGAIGDRFGLVDDGGRGFADQLKLDECDIVWHTDRTPIVAIVQSFEQLVRWAAKVASDLVFLAQSGDATMRSGGSSAMPNKRNPIDAIRVLASAATFSGLATIITGAAPHQLERGAGSWHAEWFALPLLAQNAAATLDALGHAISSLVINAADIEVPEERARAAALVAARVIARYDEHLGQQGADDGQA
jgi:3-carboxy-cis,cis-muconate cycloisomerase